MAITDCSILSALSNDEATAVLFFNTLQGIQEALDALSGGGGGGGSGNTFEEATWLAAGSIDTAATSVPNGSWTTLLNDSGNEKKYVQVVNESDADIYVSFDGATPAIIVRSNASVTVNLGATFNFVTGDISVQAVTTEPSAGLIYCSSYY